MAKLQDAQQVLIFNRWQFYWPSQKTTMEEQMHIVSHVLLVSYPNLLMESVVLLSCISYSLLMQDGNYLYLVMEYLPGGDVMVSSQGTLLPTLLLISACNLSSLFSMFCKE